MKIIIVGCGKIGCTLAAQLSYEQHDLVVVDTNPLKIQQLSETIDVMGLAGNGSSVNVLSEAGIEEADMLIAVTGSDELNLLCCVIAKKVSKCHTIARVRNPIYNKERNFIRKSLGIAMIINPEYSAAMEMFRLLRFPSAIKLDTFAKGRVELLKFKLLPEFRLDGLSIMQMVDKLRCNILVCGVERGNEVFIPSGNFVLQNGDRISIVASVKNSAAFFKKNRRAYPAGKKRSDCRRRYSWLLSRYSAVGIKSRCTDCRIQNCPLRGIKPASAGNYHHLR